MNSDHESNPVFALRCPTCDYSLRGLSKNRCPECGTHFDPEVLTLRAIRLHSRRRDIFTDLCLVPAISAVVYVAECVMIIFHVPMLPLVLLIEWAVAGLAMSAYITADCARPLAALVDGNGSARSSPLVDGITVTACGAALFLFQAGIVGVFVFAVGWLLAPGIW